VVWGHGNKGSWLQFVHLETRPSLLGDAHAAWSFVMTDLFNICLFLTVWISWGRISFSWSSYLRQKRSRLHRTSDTKSEKWVKKMFLLYKILVLMCLGTRAVAKVTGTDKEGSRISPLLWGKNLP
jgi:hypothetical protein